jgi:hypothetical protein
MLSEITVKSIYRTLFFAFCLSVILFSKTLAQTKKPDIRSNLPHPDELGNWHQEDSTLMFIGEDLFTLIDGGADIYFEYGFKQVIAAEYRNNQESSIKLELYEMSDDSAAFGIFSLNSVTQGKKAQIGNDGIFNGYYLIFWKNSFFVLLTASDTASETIAEMLAISTRIDQRLGAYGAKPKLVNYLPGSGLTACTYVRGLLGLSSQYIFDTKNIFEVKEGIIGNYQTHRLFIFKYESEEKTEQVFKNAHETLKTGGRFLNFKDVKGRYTMIDLKDQTLLVERYKNIIFAVITKHAKILDEIGNYFLARLQSINANHSN